VTPCGELLLRFFPPSFRAVSANVVFAGFVVAQAGIIGRQLLIRVSAHSSLNFEELTNGVVLQFFLSRSGSDCEARAAVLYSCFVGSDFEVDAPSAQSAIVPARNVDKVVWKITQFRKRSHHIPVVRTS